VPQPGHRVCDEGPSRLTTMVFMSGAGGFFDSLRMTSQPCEQTTVHRSVDDSALADPEEWVDRHGTVLYRYAILRVRSPDRAADLVQNTFVEALRVRHPFAGRSSEQTWLIGILRHKIIDHLRKSESQTAAKGGDGDRSVEESPFDRRGRFKASVASWPLEPSMELDTREFWEIISRCLSKLPGSLADAFFLRELDGLDSDQIQRALGITPASLWNRLHRARSLLRECLQLNWFSSDNTDRLPRRRGPARS
jgi:RNA polymerase sigma-70 factor (TIGR02943 family)